MKNLAEIIRVARIKKGISQTELAKLVGVSNISVCTWEKGKHFPSIDVFLRLVELLNIHDEVFGRALEKENANEILKSISSKLESLDKRISRIEKSLKLEPIR